jgi:hypothetical protein
VLSACALINPAERVPWLLTSDLLQRRLGQKLAAIVEPKGPQKAFEQTEKRVEVSDEKRGETARR